MTKLVKFSEQNIVKNLIPVHINKCRCDNYFWNWNSDFRDWIRGEELPQNYKNCVKSPLIKSNY